jgi:hypothetical protein
MIKNDTTADIQKIAIKDVNLHLQNLLSKISAAGALDKKGGRRYRLLLNKIWHLHPPFLSIANSALVFL